MELHTHHLVLVEDSSWRVGEGIPFQDALACEELHTHH